MPTTETPKRSENGKRGPDLNRALSTRNGTLAVATIAALLAAALLLVFLQQYRESTSEDDAAATVLVAKRLIEEGTSGDVLASEGMFQTATVPKGELKDGAVVDPSTVKGQVTVADIYPGEQLVATRFAPTTPGAQNKLSGAFRAMAIPSDPVHGNSSEVSAGDRVDLLVGIQTPDGINVIKPLMRNVLVLSVGAGAGNGAAGGGGSGPVVVKIPDARAADVAYAADHGKLWLLLRPQAGARDVEIPTVTLESLLGEEVTP
jgi:pilus assembly protein CpaB